jgi:hypothetical protein
MPHRRQDKFDIIPEFQAAEKFHRLAVTAIKKRGEPLRGDIIKQSYAPKNEPGKILEQTYEPKNKLSERCRKYDFYCQRKLNDNPALAKSLLPKIKINTGCKKRDYYCKRMSRKEWFQYINQNKSLLGSS